KGEAEAREDSRVRVVHRAIRHHQRIAVDVERVRVLHQEFAPAHYAEARPYLVAELDLDLVEVDGQLPVAPDILAHDVGHHFLVRRAEQEIPLLAVPDLQELRPELVPATRLFPQLGGHDMRQIRFERAGAIHFLAHHLLDLSQRDEAERHPAIDAGRNLLDHSCAQHQLLADDFRFGGRFLQRAKIELRDAHRRSAANGRGRRFYRPFAARPAMHARMFILVSDPADPRAWPATRTADARVAALYASAQAAMDATTGGDADAFDGEARRWLEGALGASHGGDLADALANAPSAAVARHLRRLLAAISSAVVATRDVDSANVSQPPNARASRNAPASAAVAIAPVSVTGCATFALSTSLVATTALDI